MGRRRLTSIQMEAGLKRSGNESVKKHTNMAQEET